MRRLYIGKCFDAGDFWAEIGFAFPGSRWLGVNIHQSGYGHMMPNEMRLLASFLVDAADFAEAYNNKDSKSCNKNGVTEWHT